MAELSAESVAVLFFAELRVRLGRMKPKARLQYLKVLGDDLAALAAEPASIANPAFKPAAEAADARFKAEVTGLLG